MPTGLDESLHTAWAYFKEGIPTFDVYSWSKAYSIIAQSIVAAVLRGKTEDLKAIDHFLSKKRDEIEEMTQQYRPTKVFETDEDEVLLDARRLSHSLWAFQTILNKLRGFGFPPPKIQVPEIKTLCDELVYETIISRGDAPDFFKFENLLFLLSGSLMQSLIKRDAYAVLDLAGIIGSARIDLLQSQDPDVFEALAGPLSGLTCVLTSLSIALASPMR